MTRKPRALKLLTTPFIVAAILGAFLVYQFVEQAGQTITTAASPPLVAKVSGRTVHQASRSDRSLPLAQLGKPKPAVKDGAEADLHPFAEVRTTESDPKPIPAAAAAVEQRSQGTRQPAEIVASFDGLGVGFNGPHGKANVRNPSDNSLAVGPDHVFQIVNTRVAIFTKKGHRFKETGKVLYGPVVTNAVFAGFGGQCESRNNGDAVVRYDQLAGRWLIVMPIFGRGEVRPDQPKPGVDGQPAQSSPPGRPDQPGSPFQLAPPAQPNPANPNRAAPATVGKGPY